MSINFSNSAVLQEVGTRISTKGRIVQTVHTTYTTSTTTTSTSPIDIFTSNPITLTNANNSILVEWYSENRANDWGDGVWNLYYQDIIHVNSSTQISYTGYRGEYTYSIRHYHKVAIHTPGSIGPHTYKLRGWLYPPPTPGTNTTTFVNGAGGDGVAHIRLTEIANQ